jgi:hypothetical protein
MSTDEEFQAKLELGKKAEDILFEYLKMYNGLVEDSRRQNYNDGGGPRLEGTEGSIVLPDFTVYNKPGDRRGSFAVDVKYKTSVYPINGKKCFTVDNKFEQYKKIVQIKGLDFLVIAFMFNGKFYWYKDSDLYAVTTFQNQHSTGNVYCFEYDESKIRY